MDTIYKTHLAIGHNEEEIVFLNKLVQQNLGAFLEIGVHVGGLAHIMWQIARQHDEFRYLGIENNERVIDVWLQDYIKFQSNTQFLIQDAWADITIHMIKMWLEVVPVPAIIYCDGGDKPKELGLYAPLARPGDIVAVHDYGIYERSEVSSPPEISPEQAEETMAGFARYEPAWLTEGCRIGAWRA